MCVLITCVLRMFEFPSINEFEDDLFIIYSYHFVL